MCVLSVQRHTPALGADWEAARSLLFEQSPACPPPPMTVLSLGCGTPVRQKLESRDAATM